MGEGVWCGGCYACVNYLEGGKKLGMAGDLIKRGWLIRTYTG